MPDPSPALVAPDDNPQPGISEAEAALRESEVRYRGLFDHMLNGLSLCKMIFENGRPVDYIYIAVNNVFEQLTGLHDVIGKTIGQLIPGIQQDNPELFEIYGRVASGAPPEQFETFVPALGNWYAVSVYSPEKDYFVSIFENITARKQAEQALCESEERHRIVTGLISDYVYAGVVLPDGSARTEWISGAVESITGYTSDEIIAMPGGYVSLVMPEDLQQLAAHALSLQTGEPIILEYRIRTRSGETRWLHDSMKPYPPEPGKQGIRIIGAVQDITARKRTEQALRESEERHRIVSGLISDYVYAAHIWPDGSTRTEWISGAFEAITGYTLDEVASLPGGFGSLLLLEDQERITPQIVNSQSGEMIVLEYRIRTRNGEVRWLRDSTKSYPDASGEPGVYTIGAVQDITARKRAEEALRDSEERHRTVAGLISDYVYAGILYPDGNEETEWISGAFERITGYTSAEIMNEPNRFATLIHPDDLSSMSENQAHLQTGQAVVMEYRIITRSGETRWLRDSMQPYDLERPGMSIRIVGAVQDITARKQAEQALQEANDLLEQRVRQRTMEVQDLYDNAPAGYHSLDANGVFLMINQTELNWLGYSRDEIVGCMNVRDLLTPASQIVFAENFTRFKASGRLEDLELEFACKDGHILIVSVQATAIYDIFGNYLMSRSTVFDITRRKQTEEALRISEARLRQSRDELSMANAALEKAARMKDEFLASMSHELRTPLTGILGFSEILQQGTYGALTAKQNQAVANIETSGRHLLELINDILDLSKIEMDKLELLVAPSSLIDICQASLQLTRGMAHKKSQSIDFSAPPGPIQASVDPRRLKQMLVNLLSNAVKFTPEGGSLGLDVSVSPEEDVIRLSVWDNGIGIRAEDLPRLFQPFVQLDSSLSRQHAGTGLGLALVQRMARLHGGSLEVESQPGKGSRFTILLPWVRLAGKTENSPVRNDEVQPARLQPRLVNPQVLLVDDNEITLEVTGDYLQNKGFRVVKARRGQEMLELLEQERPDIILMDIQMPGMDGLEAIRHVRTHPDPQMSPIPIIALTALAMPGDEERCLAAGANQYLSKPVRLKTLLETMHRLLAETASP